MRGLKSSAQPIDVFSLKMWQHLRGNKSYCWKDYLLPGNMAATNNHPNTDFLTICYLVCNLCRVLLVFLWIGVNLSFILADIWFTVCEVVALG